MSHHHKNETNKNMGIAFFLNLAFAIIEIIGGIITGSIAILSDAIHDLGDSLSLGASWYLEKKSNRKGNSHYTFGYKRFSLMGALLNASVLIFGGIYVLVEAGKRLFNPVAPNSEGMLWFAILGILVNGYAAFRMKKGEGGLNQKMLSWHLLEDVLGWIAVLIVSIIMMFKDIPILDPILSIAITIYVLFHVIKNLKKTLNILLDAAPEGMDLEGLKGKILNLENVVEIKQLHAWSIDGKENAFSAQIEVENGTTGNTASDLKQQIKKIVEEYDVSTLTVQIDYREQTTT